MSKKSAPARTGGGCIRWFFLGVILLLLLPVAEVGCMRVVNPPLTPLMLIRQAEARLDGKVPAPRRYAWLNLAQMPHLFLRYAITSEDQRFFLHHGFDWNEIQLARKRAEMSGKPVRGASTITMQCARSLFLWQDRSWLRKGLEAYYTFWMELILPKKRILELYANVIEMGDGIYGVEAAAQAHFGVRAQALHREQAALIVACFPNPRKRNPAHPSPALTLRAQRIMQNEPGLKIPAL